MLLQLLLNVEDVGGTDVASYGTGAVVLIQIGQRLV